MVSCVCVGVCVGSAECDDSEGEDEDEACDGESCVCAWVCMGVHLFVYRGVHL